MILLLLLLLLLPLLLFLFPHTDKCSMKSQSSPPLWSNILTMATGHVVWVLKVIPLYMEFGFSFNGIFVLFSVGEEELFWEEGRKFGQSPGGNTESRKIAWLHSIQEREFFPQRTHLQKPLCFLPVEFFLFLLPFFFFLRFLLLER